MFALILDDACFVKEAYYLLLVSVWFRLIGEEVEWVAYYIGSYMVLAKQCSMSGSRN